MEELKYIHNQANSVEQMQDEYYNQHKAKFPIMVDIWAMGRKENLELIKRCNKNK